MIKYQKYEIVKDSTITDLIENALKDNFSDNEASFFTDYIFKNFKSFTLIYDKVHLGLAVYQEIDKKEANINLIIDNDDYNLGPTYTFFLKMFIDYLFKKKNYEKLSMILMKDDLINESNLLHIGFEPSDDAIDDNKIYTLVPEKFYFLRNYKYLLLDADNTIFDFDRAEESAISVTLKKYKIEPTRNVINLYHLINIEHWQMVEKGIITREECLIKRFEVLFSKLNKNIDANKFENDYRINLDKCHYLLGNARNVLNKLVNDFDLYIVSNGVLNTQIKRLNDANLVYYFKDLFISQNIGYNKPNIEFFNYVKNHIDNFENNKSIVIGDSLTSDIKLANNAGVASIWLNFNNVDNNNHNIIPSYVIYSLDELIFAY